MALNLKVEETKLLRFVASVGMDGSDLDIFINDTLIAYISSDSGKLYLIDDLSDDLAGSGIAFDDYGKVQLG